MSYSVSFASSYIYNARADFETHLNVKSNDNEDMLDNTSDEHAIASGPRLGISYAYKKWLCPDDFGLNAKFAWLVPGILQITGFQPMLAI